MKVGINDRRTSWRLGADRRGKEVLHNKPVCCCKTGPLNMDLCEEKEDDVQPSKVSLSVEHGSQTKAKSPVQQERPDSPVPSGVSMKSDHSITEPLTFRDRNPSTEQRVQQERPDSPVPSGVSMKSNHSIAEPLTFRDRNHSTEQRAGMIGVRCASSNRPGGGGGKPDEEDRLTVATRARQKVFQ